MIDKTPYTNGMREVLQLSKAEAGRLGHDYIGPEHYLLAILRKVDGVAYRALIKLGVDLNALRDDVERRIGSTNTILVGLFSLNTGAKLALEEAKRIANELGQGWVGTEHLLLGFFRHDTTIPAQALKAIGLEYGKVLAVLRQVLHEGSEEATSGTCVTNAVRLAVTQTEEGRDLPLPAYQTEHAAGLDLLAAVPSDAPLTLAPGGWAMVPTGLKVAIPAGYEGQVRPRSGLAAKHGIGVLNAPGTIDADYRGEIKVILFNFSPEPFVIQRGERIAQLVLARHARVAWEAVAELPGSDRGEGGFGSTGR